MQDLDDLALLREYAANHSETAFEELVSRRVGFVYSAALRQVRDPHLAEEITQAVFIILAQKAGRISDKTILTGWLFKTTRFAALAQMRAEMKRSLRTATIEKEFQMQNEFQSGATDEIWNQMSPLLDEALATLGETDRQAVLLRFFENKSLAEVGNYLGAGEDTARKRVTRALEKLRKFFTKRGVSSTTAIIAGAISANSVQAAPVALAKSVTAVALAKGAAASGSTLTLIKGALKIMAWTKAKTAVVVGVAAILAVGATTITVKEIVAHREDNHDEALWRVPNPNPDVLLKATPQVTILPTKFPDDVNGWMHSGGRRWGIGLPAKLIMSFAYDCPSARVFFASGDPQKKYDFIANLPQDSDETLQRGLKNKLGLVARMEMRNADVLTLRVQIPNAPGLQPPIGRIAGGTERDGDGDFQVYNEPISAQHPSMNFTLTMALEGYFGMPVVDQTGLKQNFQIHLQWKVKTDPQANQDAIKQALLDQLGLELVSTNMPIEMLVVEKAN